MKILIVDDETLPRKRIRNLIEDSDTKSRIQESCNGEEAIESIDAFQPDLIYLDVNLKDMTGFDVLKSIKTIPKPLVIFVTAYDNHAIKAFDFDAFDFLLKPFKDERFYVALKKAKERSNSTRNQNFDEQFQKLLELKNQSQSSIAYPSKIPVKQGNKTVFVNIKDIEIIAASGYYAELLTPKKKYLLRESLKNLMDILDPNLFHRIHRSTIINLDAIEEIIHSDYSEIDVKMIDGTLVHVSKSHKKDFFNKLGL